MLLRELYYFDNETGEPSEDDRYDTSYDKTRMRASDTRKTRLTLRQLNRIRKSADVHRREKEKDLVSVKNMYGRKPEEGQGF